MNSTSYQAQGLFKTPGHPHSQTRTIHIQTVDGYSYHLTPKALKQTHKMCLASFNPHSDCSVSVTMGLTPGYTLFFSRAVNISMTGSTWRANYLLSWLSKDLCSRMHLVAQRHWESRELHEFMHHCSICIAREHKLVQLASSSTTLAKLFFFCVKTFIKHWKVNITHIGFPAVRKG